MENKNETLTVVDRLNNIIKRIDLTKTLDMDKLPDLEKAKEYIENLKSDFKKLSEDSPFIHNMMNWFGSISNIDVRNELEKMGKMIEEKMNEIKSDLKAAEVIKTECDCSEDSCQCEYNDCVNHVFGDELTLDDEPMTGMDVYRELDEEVVGEMKSTKAQAESISNLIANYLNENYGYLDHNDTEDADEIHYLSNTLFEFADYVWHK